MVFSKPLHTHNIFHIEFESQFLITSTLMRIQEYYESSIPSIKGTYFTLESLIHEYTITNGGEFNYFTKWSGFNFPQEVLIGFIKKFIGNISEKELSFINFLADNIAKLQDVCKDYYIVATYRDEDINHELAHGLFYMDSGYRSRMEDLIGDLNPECHEALYEQLYNDGYCEDVIYDEIQAYMSTSSELELRNYLGININSYTIKQFQEVFNEYVAIR